MNSTRTMKLLSVLTLLLVFTLSASAQSGSSKMTDRAKKEQAAAAKSMSADQEKAETRTSYVIMTLKPGPKGGLVVDTKAMEESKNEAAIIAMKEAAYANKRSGGEGYGSEMAFLNAMSSAGLKLISVVQDIQEKELNKMFYFSKEVPVKKSR